jgi:hypothetical protein
MLDFGRKLLGGHQKNVGSLGFHGFRIYAQYPYKAIEVFLANLWAFFYIIFMLLTTIPTGLKEQIVAFYILGLDILFSLT